MRGSDYKLTPDKAMVQRIVLTIGILYREMEDAQFAWVEPDVPRDGTPQYLIDSQIMNSSEKTMSFDILDMLVSVMIRLLDGKHVLAPLWMPPESQPVWETQDDVEDEDQVMEKNTDGTGMVVVFSSSEISAHKDVQGTTAIKGDVGSLGEHVAEETGRVGAEAGDTEAQDKFSGGEGRDGASTEQTGVNGEERVQ